MKKAFLLTLCLLSPLFLSACQQGGGDPAKRSDGAKEMIVDPRIPSGKVYEFDEVDPREKGEVRSLSSVSDLLLFQQKVNQADPDYVNGYFQLESDISLTDEWIPISGFKGQLNGQGHAIRGISIEGDKNKKGFFSSLDGAKIGCITFEGHVAAGDTASLVAGYTLGDCSFVGVTVEGTMDVSNNAGGLIGTLAGGSVKAVGCINHAIIRGGSYLGGLIGANKSYKVNISDSANCASVLGDGSTIGGIIGSLTHSISQTNDYSLVDCFNYGLVKGRSYAGGVVGLSSARLIRCGAGKDAKVYAISDSGETEATTLTSFASPYCSVLSGNLLYNTAINEYGELIGCENQFGFAVTGINDPAGCTRIIPYKDKIMLFAATNKYAISEDDGATFGPFRTVSDKTTEICPIDGEKSTDTGNTQPWVLADGRIIMMYRAIRVSTSFSYASLRMRISDENGEFDSADEPIMLIENFTENTGKAGAFYEPYPIVLDDGSLAIYISEDVHYSAPFDNGSYRIPKLKDDLICDGGSQDTVMIPLRIAPGATEVGPGKIEVGESADSILASSPLEVVSKHKFESKKDACPDYYALPKKGFGDSRDSFLAALGRDVPADKDRKKRPYDLHSTMEDLQGTWIGNTAKKFFFQKMEKDHLGKEEKKMMQEAFYATPMRSLSTGGVSDKLGQVVVDMANRRPFSALWHLVFTKRRKRNS